MDMSFVTVAEVNADYNKGTENKEERHMNFAIRGTNIEVTEALKKYAENKISRIEKYFADPLKKEVHVLLSLEKDRHRIEVTIPLDGFVLRAEERSTDMYASIDQVEEKLKRQIRKYKTRINRKHRQNGESKKLFAEEHIDVSDEDDFNLVRTKFVTCKPMDSEEAILQMNMLDHDFFVFSNSDSGRMNVIYKRTDGKYGIICPK